MRNNILHEISYREISSTALYPVFDCPIFDSPNTGTGMRSETLKMSLI
jgi:hypothetical protein